MVIIIIYLLLCALMGWVAEDKTLGFWGGFLLSVLFTPVGGFIILLFYPSREHRDRAIHLQQQILDQHRMAAKAGYSSADELAKWKAQHDAGIITQAEFDDIKRKLLKDIG